MTEATPIVPKHIHSSCRLELRNEAHNSNAWTASLNYTRIGANNRFLSPREWGKEPFYTFIPRERTEGVGDSHAFVVRGSKEFLKKRLLTELAAGYVDVPDIGNYKLNKYGTLSYDHIYARAFYTFDKTLKGFTADMIYVYKKKEGDDHGNARNVINRVNMSLFNFIVNYRF
jgi:hypothetical protein